MSAIDALSYSDGVQQCQPVEPDPLIPLIAPLTSLRGVGDAVGKLIARAVGGDRVLDLLFHLPESYLDRRARCAIRAALPGQICTLEVEVIRIEPPATPRQPTKVTVGDGSGFADLVFFQRFPAGRLAVGSRVVVSGKLDERRQMVHPDHIVPAGQAEGFPGIEQVWPLTAGLFAWHLRRPVAECLSRLPDYPEWQDPALLRREGWPGFGVALRGLQAPVEPPSPALRRRLAYDELLAHQVSLAVVRRRERARAGTCHAGH